MIPGPRTKIIVDSDDEFEDDSEDLTELGEDFRCDDEGEYYADLIDSLDPEDANLLFDPSWEKDIR